MRPQLKHKTLDGPKRSVIADTRNPQTKRQIESPDTPADDGEHQPEQGNDRPPTLQTFDGSSTRESSEQNTVELA